MRKVALIILDGWGHGQHPASDAIYQAQVPFVKSLYRKYPNTELCTSGEAVGLPEGQMGNSEVGHLNLGAGRVVYQELVRINRAIRDGTLEQNSVLKNLFSYCHAQQKPLHLMGLVSDGGVHSHINHLIALVRYAHRAAVPAIYIHAFTDGRDTDPKSGIGFIRQLLQEVEGTGAQLASVVGRYYAMDRDHRWQRTALAYALLTKGQGTPATDAISALQQSYEAGITDEFVEPISLRDADGQAVAVIRPGDAVLCFNFRTDRCRQITRALTQEDFPQYHMYRMPLRYVTMTQYDATFVNVDYLIGSQDLNHTLGEIISNQGWVQLRIAETEKYPHVTYFFNGGREEPFPGEHRILVPSPRVATYDLQPEMSAREVTQALLQQLDPLAPMFICLNFANPDMVGHTGNFAAVVAAVETVDQCVAQVTEALVQRQYTIILTADHGNADYMINEDGSPNTAHTLNPVPLFLINGPSDCKLQKGKLADIAPTILYLMGVPLPDEMDGNNLIVTHPSAQ
ncbi:MAG: 2,3-bisphosphoglycerate-independent phosphoglycerate mutase [Chitinophagales bacterium]|nr:2,3-bisphosphoglycerate-independent phosphoglycerate mutase [Chitinophagales bacterium]MDW8428793.1 2,3-bisphosphoglycerate-independent phosphoglycerate mutase [Chitinophagales bacterium]